jgi:hypothetical protein
MNLDEVLAELRVELELLDASIHSLESLAPVNLRTAQGRRGRSRAQPPRRHRRAYLTEPPRAAGAGPESH